VAGERNRLLDTGHRTLDKLMAMANLSQSLRLWPDNWLRPIPLAGLFGNDHPIEVDLGCGKGRFLLARAAAHPEVNFLGIDRMLERIRKIDHRAGRRGLSNIRLLRLEGYYAVAHLMPPAAISSYFIFFPDPWPKKKHRDHRIFNPRFVDALHRTLVPGGAIHVATDHLPYFEEIRGILAGDSRFQPIEPLVPSEGERTDFERWYIERGPIGRCSFVKK
jgi:tRNA (guanine-N7-)-methyltransferase